MQQAAKPYLFDPPFFGSLFLPWVPKSFEKTSRHRELQPPRRQTEWD